jgi:MoxR-like ATPase
MSVSLVADVEAFSQLEPFYHTVEQVLIGQRRIIDQVLIGLLTDGHVLLEGVPGLAKTTAVRTIAQAMHLSFRRIQFTPDLLPADVIGTQIYNPRTGEFTIKNGPVFTQILLADEINRAPAKVQSALLEAMAERQVTIGESSFQLPRPFFVLATQNPIEQEGTYSLPEAQLDRFMLKILIDYPSAADELRILDRMGSIDAQTQTPAVMPAEGLARMRQAVDATHVAESVKEYLLKLVRATRQPAEFGLANLKPLLRIGASPRASLALLRASKAQAFLKNRGYVTPEEVKQTALDVLRHRVMISYEAEAEELTADVILKRILDHVPVP